MRKGWKIMKFEFGILKSEKIYDNHGCPWLTEYKINFKVDGINFIAMWADTYRNIELFHKDHKDTLITDEIYRNSGAGDIDSIHQVIQTAFSENDLVKKAFHKLKGDELDILKENLYESLLTNCE